MATVSRGNEPVGYALSLHRTCTTACSSEIRQFTEPHSLLMDSLQLWSAHQIAERRPITKFCYFRTTTSTTGTATPHSHCPRCRPPHHRPHYNAAVVSSSCVCEVSCCGRMTWTCDNGDDVNSSNACGMPSVTMVLSVSPPAHNHHSLSGWRQSQLCVCNIRSFQINVSKLHECILVNKYLQWVALKFVIQTVLFLKVYQIITEKHLIS